MKLSKRLKAIAHMVPGNSRVGDIGTDHGQLPCYLATMGLASHIIAADVNQQPLANAKKRVAEMGLEEKIQTRLGNGLEVLAPGEVDVVTISGMGGSLMQEILNANMMVVNNLTYMVLQPNLAANLIRQWAWENQWQIDDEDLVYEDGRFYVILTLKPGGAQNLSEVDMMVGPKLLEKSHRLLPQYLQHEYEGEKNIMKQLIASGQSAAMEKYHQLEKKWSMINEVILCQYNVTIL